MNPFDCNVTNATSTTPIPPPQVPRYCPVDKTNCTVGAKQPFYWLQNEGNNIFNDSFDPPTYSDNYGFKDGAQDDLWDLKVQVPSSPLPVASPPTKSASQVPSATSSTTVQTSTAPAPVPDSTNSTASADPYFDVAVDLANAPNVNATTPTLNSTDDSTAPSSNAQSTRPTSPIQHLLADNSSARKIR
ncbi:hypothetical protein FRC12_001454, partial [Ceratobasidium sp. 428]